MHQLERELRILAGNRDGGPRAVLSDYLADAGRSDEMPTLIDPFQKYIKLDRSGLRCEPFKLANGWTVSVQAGPGMYCAPVEFKLMPYQQFILNPIPPEAYTAWECAVMHGKNKGLLDLHNTPEFKDFPDILEYANNQIQAWVPTELVQRLLNFVEQLPWIK